MLPWLLGIATNLVRRQYRTKARQLKAYASTGIDPVSTLDEDAVIERADSAERLQQVAAALSELDQLDRDLLFLFAALNLSYQQVADALGMPLGSVKSRMSRAANDWKPGWRWAWAEEGGDERAGRARRVP